MEAAGRQSVFGFTINGTAEKPSKNGRRCVQRSYVLHIVKRIKDARWCSKARECQSFADEMMHGRTLLLGLGSNLGGPWGSARATLARALRELTGAGLPILGFPSLYATTPVGIGRQPVYFNAIAIAEASVSPAALLRTL